jgi:tRNA (guanine-N(7)-)-methyltransferase subunit TRM82
VKAIFSWQLTNTDELKFPSIIQVPGNPLSLALAQSGTDLPSLVVALDTTEEAGEPKAESLNVYALTTNDGKLAVEAVKPIPASATKSGDADILDAPAEEIKRTLYGIESLRKVRVDYEAEAEDGQGEGPETEADAGEGAGENE